MRFISRVALPTTRLLAFPAKAAAIPSAYLPLAHAAAFVNCRVVRTFSQQATAEPMATEPLPEEPVASSDASAAAAGTGPAAELKALAAEIATLKASVAELNATRLRLLAEMENVRMIAKRDVDQAKSYALQSFGKRLLEVADNLERAVQSVPAELRVKKEGNEVLPVFYEGVAATEREMIKTLASAGIEGFGAKGDKFDPNKYEAMMQVPATPDAPANTVSLLLKRGFTLKDRVLRPAQVAVAI